MSGFVDIMKIILKVAAFPLLLLAIYAILNFNFGGSFGEAISFLSGGVEVLFNILNSVYRIVYFYTGGLFAFPFAVALVGIGIKVSYATAIFAIWGYKWYIKVLSS